MANQQLLNELWAALPRGQGAGELTEEDVALVRAKEQLLSSLDLVTPTAFKDNSLQQLITFGLSPGVATLLKRAFPGQHLTTTTGQAANRGLGSNTFNSRMHGFEVTVEGQLQQLRQKLEQQADQLDRQSDQLTRQSDQLTRQSDQLTRQAQELQEVKQENSGLFGGHFKVH